MLPSCDCDKSWSHSWWFSVVLDWDLRVMRRVGLIVAESTSFGSLSSSSAIEICSCTIGIMLVYWGLKTNLLLFEVEGVGELVGKVCCSGSDIYPRTGDNGNRGGITVTISRRKYTRRGGHHYNALVVTALCNMSATTRLNLLDVGVLRHIQNFRCCQYSTVQIMLKLVERVNAASRSPDNSHLQTATRLMGALIRKYNEGCESPTLRRTRPVTSGHSILL